jgi:redox-sensitive bicupin YhaK (pirin superfamily)
MITSIEQRLQPEYTSDGAGVNLTRYIGTENNSHIDPFLLFDCFHSDNPDDYIAGFPSHPHRGFETITYMLEGSLKHKDNKGYIGNINSGDVQWMTAGKGIIHSEMPQQKNGLLYGFQIWINLPSHEKMCKPQYQEVQCKNIPIDSLVKGQKIKVISGETPSGISGLIKTKLPSVIFWDITLEPNSSFHLTIPSSSSTLIFIIEGNLLIGKEDQVTKKELIKIANIGETTLKSYNESHFLIISAPTINEHIERYGPFVMNTQEEIKQAISDYNGGGF